MTPQIDNTRIGVRQIAMNLIMWCMRAFNTVAQAFASGWGSLSTGDGPFPNHLHGASIRTHTRAQCAAGFSLIEMSHPVICAGGSTDGSRGVCVVSGGKMCERYLIGSICVSRNFLGTNLIIWELSPFSSSPAYGLLVLYAAFPYLIG